MKITWLGHSAFRLDFADRVVLLDPFFTGNPAFEGNRDQVAEGVTHVSMLQEPAVFGFRVARLTL